MAKRLRRAGSPWRLLVHEYAGEGMYGVSHHVANTPPRGEPKSAWRRNHLLDNTEFDELVVGGWLHVEQMDSSVWWMNVGGVTINIRVDRDGRAKAVDVYGPGDYDDAYPGVVYELTWSGDAQIRDHRVPDSTSQPRRPNMINSRIAFVDTETTGLALDDEIWEFAAIVREPDGSETTCHMFIEHDPGRCAALPGVFLSDHMTRFPAGHAEAQHPDVATREQAAKEIAALFPSNVPMRDRPHIVGCVPDFDTARIALLLRRYGLEPGWHYHLIDVENLAVGWLHGRGYAENVRVYWDLPWDSEALSCAVGIDPDQFERHTALGDVKWAQAVFDALTHQEDR